MSVKCVNYMTAHKNVERKKQQPKKQKQKTPHQSKKFKVTPMPDSWMFATYATVCGTDRNKNMNHSKMIAKCNFCLCLFSHTLTVFSSFFMAEEKEIQYGRL